MSVEAVLSLFLSVGASAATAIASLLVARKFQKLGGSEAQVEYNDLLIELKQGYAEQVALKEAEVERVKAELALARARVAELEKQDIVDRREKAALESDIRHLNDELRDLRAKMVPK